MCTISALLKCQILVIGLIFWSDCFTTSVSGKRGCSSFGHSCYGGHGKRSKVTDDYTARARSTNGLTNSFTNDKYFTKHHSKLVMPHFINLYKTSDGPPNGDVKTLLKKLVKSINEYQRSHSSTSYLGG